MSKEKKVCCICGVEFVEFGNNPEPIKSEGNCCNWCNEHLVIPLRLKMDENAKEK